MPSHAGCLYIGLNFIACVKLTGSRHAVHIVSTHYTNGGRRVNADVHVNSIILRRPNKFSVDSMSGYEHDVLN